MGAFREWARTSSSEESIRLRRENGKPPKVALVAVMRKMLSVLNRMIADPNFSLA